MTEAPQTPEIQARNAALRYLTSRARSRAEVRTKLLALGFSEALCEATISWLGSLQYVDDAALTEALVRSAEKQGFGPRRLQQTLVRRGLGMRPGPEVSADTQEQRCREVASTFMRKQSAAQPAERRVAHLLGHLLRRGFEPDVARRVAFQHLHEADALEQE